ncbi:hypothetical protein IAR50_004391 [Cryptococcus sp. DSM 104548]
MRIPYRRHYHRTHPHPKKQVRADEGVASSAAVTSTSARQSTGETSVEGTTSREVVATSSAVSSVVVSGETSSESSKGETASSATKSAAASTHLVSSSAITSSSSATSASAAKSSAKSTTAETSSTRSTPVNPIQLTTFPSNFPVETRKDTTVHDLGRGYIFLPNDTAADSMLLFVTFFFAFLVFTIIFIRCTSFLDRRRARKRGGRVKEDTVVGEEMKWAEGREVVERKIVWQNAGHGQRGQRGISRDGTRGLKASGLRVAI